MPKIHLLSDLHTEFWKQGQKLEDLIRPADVLVLAGDVGVGPLHVAPILNYYSYHYKDVVYVMGNHECYSGIELKAFEVPKNFRDKLEPNVHFLNANDKIIQGVNFIGAPLWSNFNEDPLAEHAAKSMINDFRRIANFTPKKCKGLFYEHFQFIKYAYDKRDQALPTVIVTHFLPSHKCVADRFAGSGLLNYYFANSLDYFIEDLENTTWLHGHTHDPVNVTIGSTRVLANPLGYPNERSHFNHLIFDPSAPSAV